jgi:hypothetical protein
MSASTWHLPPLAWTHLLERSTLRAFVTHLDSNGIGPEGMSMKTYGCVRVIFGRAYYVNLLFYLL